MKQAISVMYNLTEQGGGITRVSLARTQALAKAGVKARIAVLSSDDKLDKTFENLVAQGRISSDTQVVNYQRWFARKAAGLLDSGEVNTLDHLRVKVRKRVDHVNGLGLKIVRYLTVDNVVFMEEFLDHKDVIVAVIISIPGNPVLKFNSIQSAHAYWLKQLSEECLPAFLISDALQGADTVCKVEGSRIHRLLMIHSHHLQKPYTVGSTLAPKYEGVVRGLPVCERVVVLTEAQRRDLKEQFASDKYACIGNPVVLDDTSSPVDRDPNLAVVVARLHVIKRIKNIIRAFAKVIAEKKDARLEIWGSGEQQQELQDEIEKLGLSSSIMLMGFATDVSKIFRRASVSLAMSHTEGFGVSFAESLAYGTPLVSLDTKYGPGEIITNEVDGFIVYSERDFVERTLQLLSDPDLVREMGERGALNMSRFSTESITKKWLDLFDEVDSEGVVAQVARDHDCFAFKNSVASKFGWVYLPEATEEQANAIYKTASRVYVRGVDSSKQFLGEPTGIEAGSFEVDEMVFDAPKGVYRFRLMKDGLTFKGVIAASAIECCIY